MATNRRPEMGVIILGNGGSGKSFLCNILIGNERFKSEFASSAVTTETEHQRMSVEGLNLRIYNIPGLIEAKQEAIERNKREIMKAFADFPNSIVLFVWGHVGGRLQPDDVIAFKAINEAYKFPQGSLAFVVNNLDPKRKAEYDGKFMVNVKTDLAPLTYPLSDFIFIDHVDPNSEGAKQKYNQTRLQLLNLIKSRKVAVQTIHNDIKFDTDKLNELRLEVEKQREQARKDKDQFQRTVAEMTRTVEMVKEDARMSMKKMKEALSDLEDENREGARQVKKIRKKVKEWKDDYGELKDENKELKKDIEALKLKVRSLGGTC